MGSVEMDASAQGPFTTDPLTLTDDVPLLLGEKIVFGIIATLGITGNSLAIYVLAYVVSSRRGNTNILLVNQSLIDLTSSVLLVLCFLLPKVDASTMPTAAGRVLVCYVWNSKYLFWATTLTSTANQLCLTFERYYATLHPLNYRNQSWLVWPRSLALATLPWMVGYLVESYWPFRHYMDKKNQCLLSKFHSQTGKIIYAVAVLFFDYILPLALMVFAYVRIYKALQVEPTSNSTSPNERTPIVQPTNLHRELESRRIQRNVIRTLITLSTVFSLCWLPNQFAYFYFNVSDNVHINIHVYSASICIAFLNMCVNPFIYTLQYHQFREGLQKALPGLARLALLRKPSAASGREPH